jgi:hypothetical protein
MHFDSAFGKLEPSSLDTLFRLSLTSQAQILVDCMQYQHSRLLLTAARLLNRFWSLHTDLCDLTITAQVHECVFP